jgi:uncharacterized linocin/CFP29 family protein
MTDFLGHAENPLRADEWDRLNQTVIEVARRTLVARRFIDLYGPLGAGVQTVPQDQFKGAEPGSVDLTGENETTRVFADKRTFLTIPLIYKDFLLHWRDIEAARSHNMPLDVSAAAGAAAFCAQREDEIIFFGNKDQGTEGLLTAKGRNTHKRGDWSTPGNAFADIVAATEKLNSCDHYGPYALVVSPKLYAQLHRIFEKTGVLEIETIRKLCTDGVFRSNRLQEGQSVLVSTGRENFDLAVSMDMTVAYLGAENMNHPFRVVESVLLRIKHPDAICTLDA